MATPHPTPFSHHTSTRPARGLLRHSLVISGDKTTKPSSSPSTRRTFDLDGHRSVSAGTALEQRSGGVSGRRWSWGGGIPTDPVLEHPGDFRPVSLRKLEKSLSSTSMPFQVVFPFHVTCEWLCSWHYVGTICQSCWTMPFHHSLSARLSSSIQNVVWRCLERWTPSVSATHTSPTTVSFPTGAVSLYGTMEAWRRKALMSRTCGT